LPVAITSANVLAKLAEVYDAIPAAVLANQDHVNGTEIVFYNSAT
jgi:hypothetical protein